MAPIRTLVSQLLASAWNDIQVQAGSLRPSCAVGTGGHSVSGLLVRSCAVLIRGVSWDDVETGERYGLEFLSSESKAAMDFLASARPPFRRLVDIPSSLSALRAFGSFPPTSVDIGLHNLSAATEEGVPVASEEAPVSWCKFTLGARRGRTLWLLPDEAIPLNVGLVHAHDLVAWPDRSQTIVPVRPGPG